jgi:hypothetical protein
LRKLGFGIALGKQGGKGRAGQRRMHSEVNGRSSTFSDTVDRGFHQRPTVTDRDRDGFWSSQFPIVLKVMELLCFPSKSSPC